MVTDQASDACPQAVLWPAIILKGMTVALALRLFEHFTGLEAFEPKEFLNLPVFVTIFCCAVALLGHPSKNTKPRPDTRKARRDRRAWLLVTVIFCGALAVRAVLHWTGLIDYKESSGLVMALAIIFVYPLWMTRIK